MPELPVITGTMFRRAMLASALAGMAVACSSDDGTTTSQGSWITEMGNMCALSVRGSSGRLTLNVAKNGNFIDLIIDKGEANVDRTLDEVDFYFLVRRMDGTEEEIAQDSIRYSKVGTSMTFGTDAPEWLIRQMADLDSIEFHFRDRIANTIDPPRGWGEEAELLSGCLSKPVDQYELASG